MKPNNCCNCPSFNVLRGETFLAYCKENNHTRRVLGEFTEEPIEIAPDEKCARSSPTSIWTKLARR